MHVGEERRAADGVGEEGEERDVSWGALRFFFFFLSSPWVTDEVGGVLRARWPKKETDATSWRKNAGEERA